MLDPLRQFAEMAQGPPGEAMRVALDGWEEHAPRLLEALAAYAEDRDRSEAAASIACHATYLAAQKRERQAFPALCRLARDNDALEQAIGDGITEDLAAILAQTFDDDRERLLALILDESADEFVRNAAIRALARLFAEGRLPMAEAEACLRDLHDRMLPRRQPDWVWVGWVQAVSALGLRVLQPQAAALFRSGRIDRSIMDRRDFEADLREGTAPGADRLALLARHGVASIEDAPAMFDAWHRQREEEARRPPPAPTPATLGPAFREALQEPAFNPYRDVGRNDPCPCGSGKKFKKCCMPG